MIKFLSRQFDSSEWKNEALWEDGNGQVVHVTDNYVRLTLSAPPPQ